MLTYLTNEVRYLGSGQAEIVKMMETIKNVNSSIEENTTIESILISMPDCPMPINNLIDLNVLEDKISGDNVFRMKLVLYF